MHRFFVDPPSGGVAALSPDEAAHALRVLRLKSGDSCQAIWDGRLFAAEIAAVSPTVTLRLGAELPSPEPSVSVTLYQGLPKGDKMEYIVQKCTEAGVCRIVPVLFSRCVAQWDGKDTGKKLPRWQRIAAEAAKQAGRAVVPEVLPPVTPAQLTRRLQDEALALVPWEEQAGNGAAAQWRGQKRVAVVIGPEGGIAPAEIALLQEAGAVPVTLGPRIFRTETAGLAAIISLFTVSGDMT